MTLWDRQGVSDGRCDTSREQMPPLEEAARHQGLQEDLLLTLDQRVGGELRLGSAASLSFHFSCGCQDGELQAGTWGLAATGVFLSVLGSSPAPAWLMELDPGVPALSKLRKHLRLPNHPPLPSELVTPVLQRLG